MFKFLFVTLLSGFYFIVAQAQAQAQNQAQILSCDISHAHALASLNELPVEVQGLLGRSVKGVSGIADMNEKFNPSDVILDPAIPMRRLVNGGASDTCIRMTVEYGGRGYYTEQLEFHLTVHGWVKVAEIHG